MLLPSELTETLLLHTTLMAMISFAQKIKESHQLH